MTQLKDGEWFFHIEIFTGVKSSGSSSNGKMKKKLNDLCTEIHTYKYKHTYSKGILGHRCCFFPFLSFTYFIRVDMQYVQNVREQKSVR